MAVDKILVFPKTNYERYYRSSVSEEEMKELADKLHKETRNRRMSSDEVYRLMQKSQNIRDY